MGKSQTQYATSGDVHLAYQVIGEGPRDIVLVIDWASQLEVLSEQPFVQEFLSSLTRYARVLWFDMRGVGLSDRVFEQPVAPEEWMLDVGAVMDAAGSSRATLLAQGHAAQLALLFAAAHPERVESLVVINGFARLAQAPDYPAGMPEHIGTAILDMVAREWGTGSMAGVLGPSVASQDGLQEWYGRLERYAVSPGAAVAKMRAILELDVRHVLPLVAAPTLVIQNRGNQLVRQEHGRYLAANIPGAQLLERDSPDHWPLPEPDMLGAIEEFVTGSRSEVDVDRFLATVMFVDVAGSTERLTELGDTKWRTLLDQFEEIVERQLIAHRGDLVDKAGDGVMATFDGPARAIRCACRIRDAVRPAGLDVRCGLHTGEVTRRNGGIAGIAVHIGARVSSVANPGEVLVTRTVRDLVAGSGIAFDERGEHELKGVADRWTLYATGG